jgi:hypothetical protein
VAEAASIGIDQQIALGRVSEELTTSSAMLANYRKTQHDEQDTKFDLHLLIPIIARYNPWDLRVSGSCERRVVLTGPHACWPDTQEINP